MEQYNHELQYYMFTYMSRAVHRLQSHLQVPCDTELSL